MFQASGTSEPTNVLSTRSGRRKLRLRAKRRRGTASIAILVASALTLLGVIALPSSAALINPGPVGGGFTVTAGDLSFILKQIKIAERHATTYDSGHPCSTMLNSPTDTIPDSEQVPDILTSYGLRSIDGSCNNLKTGDEFFAASDQVFPRLTSPVWRPSATLPGFPVPTTPTYQGTGNVVDTQPRIASNLIVDQTSTNPAAVAAAGAPVRSQDPTATTVPCAPGTVPDTSTAVICTPPFQTLFIPNVTTDVGLSPPYNSLFTFFGQFFDHGVDQTVKSGSAVFVPLQADDPLIAGPDHILGNADDLSPNLRFMVLTRAQNQPGAVQNATNTDTPWVDQSQTYTSHSSHQVFLREYAAGTGVAGRNNPAAVATGKLLSGLAAGQTYTGSPDMTEGESTWASVKLQARTRLGLLLRDADVTNIPLLAVDPYGKYIPGTRGLPQYVTATGLVEGNLAAPVAVPNNVLHFDTPFVTDIAHNADPSPVDTDNNPGTPPVAPTADPDTTVQTNFKLQAAGTYDDELLAAHAACGDGRCNENIALTTVHQVFHAEHNRLVSDIDATLHATGNAALLAAYQAAGVVGGANHLGTGGYNYGERLFQAARFVTEMEYQHLVFEEFARKMVPAIRPFHIYSPDINAAIEAEFAHAVYRFGHSMLDDTVARTRADGSDSSLLLLDAFLNPPALYSDGAGGTLSAPAGAGAVVMGSVDQTGNELDEFVTETLRNNLLGLPLDLATINMARARETGVPPLNDLRRQIYAETNDGQLAPYGSWSEYGQHLKHPESLINFVAAYGKHPTITGATTLAGKRAAARAIVDPQLGDVVPTDAAAFMFGTGAWVDVAGKTSTGLDDVDLWVGGLAEVTNLFGGLLGSTFNYVFQTQLEKLQDGDRFYYLQRTPGMNLRTQLEGNSFSEMIQRNLDNTNTLKADAFATADCKFQLANLAGTPAGFTASGATVADDPKTVDCDESLLLLRLPDGTIKYRQTNTVDPPGINGQSVYQGTSAADRIYGGNDNDTFWGGAGNDRIEGNGGDDVTLGGEGNDILTDLDGADVQKGGPGNDAIDGGPGDDIPMGGDGQDFINGGANDNETFAGPGNDFIIAGQGADAVFGDGGDDWIEGGSGQDLLQGDHGAPFFDDPAESAPGNDIFVGQVGENDYDAEGGDDIMSQNAAVDRNAGAGGFDWAIHQYDTVPANDDMMINNNLGGLPIQVIVNRDRWQETEADSGGPLNDVMLGTDGVLATPRLISGGGFTGCDAIDQAGMARIKGLSGILPPVSTWQGTAAAVALLSASGTCPLTGPVWGEGDILLGDGGSDTFTGRAGDEIIDGDRSLRVAITVRTNPALATSEIGRTDLMENRATSGNFGAGTAGMTLQQAVFAGLVDPGNLVAVREIVTPTSVPAPDCAAVAPLNCDTAVFSGPQADYALGRANGALTVTDTTGTEGVDTLRNIERLRFADGDVLTQQVAVPTNVIATLLTGRSARVNFTAGTAVAPVLAATSFDLLVLTDGIVTRTIPNFTSGSTVTALAPGTTSFQVVGVRGNFDSGPSAESNAITTAATAPTAPRTLVATAVPLPAGSTAASPASIALSWVAPLDDGGSPITSYQISYTRAGQPATIVSTAPAVTTLTLTGLLQNTSYTITVSALNAVGTSPAATVARTTLSAPVAGGLVAPAIGRARQGASNGIITAIASWAAPVTTGGSPIASYRVLTYAADGVTLIAQANVASTTFTTNFLSVNAPALTLEARYATNATVRFRVRAVNTAGTVSAESALSNAVVPR